jgi:hypothetical protein
MGWLVVIGGQRTSSSSLEAIRQLTSSLRLNAGVDRWL